MCGTLHTATTVSLSPSGVHTCLAIILLTALLWPMQERRSVLYIARNEIINLPTHRTNANNGNYPWRLQLRGGPHPASRIVCATLSHTISLQRGMARLMRMSPQLIHAAASELECILVEVHVRLAAMPRAVHPLHEQLGGGVHCWRTCSEQSNGPVKSTRSNVEVIRRRACCNGSQQCRLTRC